MDFEDKTIRRFTVMFLLIVLAVLTFFLIKPVLISIIIGLILAYVFLPVYRKLNNYITNQTLCASVVTLLVLFIALVPLWFIIPIIFKQGFEIFKYLQTVNVDVHEAIKFIFPTASDQFISQLTITIGSIASEASSAFLSSLTSTFVEIPSILFGIFIIGFIFFYGLKDSEKLYDFVNGISPLSKAKEEILVRQFKDITYAVIYGQIIIGLIQGGLASLGLLLFGVPNALVLSMIVIFLSVIPLLGPFIVWVPVSLYLFATATPGLALGYILYNLLIVSTIDNVLRSYIIAKKIKISNAVVFVGMIGGLFAFGIIGLILGPLILSYFIKFLEAYKEKSFSSSFFEE